MVPKSFFLSLLAALVVSSVAASAFSSELTDAYSPILQKTGFPLTDFVRLYKTDLEAHNMTMKEWITILVNGPQPTNESQMKRDVSCTGNGACDDGNECTTADKCVNGVCRGLAYFTDYSADCNDGNQCTNTDKCIDGGFCVGQNSGTSVTCDDGLKCTDNDKCNGNGGCAGIAKVCDDSNACTQNKCDETQGCFYTDLVCHWM
eukprot:TRINITY_DN64_c0_g1_i15.p1 TRINITY_DN64_c0_g1~~TRINITY_DN64_c0_g1_i15.p1  ORF type:complete len:204 (+),score=22.00 TRINITY_DN64_c0_g1_i15:94-705(+)